jgi:hypothetical protein
MLAGLANANGKSNRHHDDEVATRLPIKRCTVYVSTSFLLSSQLVSVLSAALSSKGRISRDKDDAGRILGMLDKVRGIEAGSRLADLLRLLNPGTELHSVNDKDVPMYRSRTSGACICSHSTMDTPQHAFVLASRGDNPTRLKGADEILAKVAEDRRNGHSDAFAEEGETTSSDAKTDMLVKPLNDSIARALEKVQEMAQRGPSCLIDHETDAAARKIESAEQASMQEWIKNRSVLDEDGRARCSLLFVTLLPQAVQGQGVPAQAPAEEALRPAPGRVRQVPRRPDDGGVEPRRPASGAAGAGRLRVKVRPAPEPGHRERQHRERKREEPQRAWRRRR